MTGIVEIEGEFESVPDDVYESYHSLSYKEKLQVIKKVANYELRNRIKRLISRDKILVY